MRQPTLRILLLEDSPADAELVTLELRHAGLDAVTQRADTEDAFVRAVRDFAPDVVLSDHSLAPFNSTAAPRLLPGGGDEAPRHPRDRWTGALRRPRPPHFRGELRRPARPTRPRGRIPSYAGAQVTDVTSLSPGRNHHEAHGRHSPHGADRR